MLQSILFSFYQFSFLFLFFGGEGGGRVHKNCSFIVFVGNFLAYACFYFPDHRPRVTIFELSCNRWNVFTDDF